MSKHRIEITVKPKADKSKGKHKSPPRPLIRTGDSPDVLSRRAKSGIRLFDLGQRRSGSTWTSIDLQIAPTLAGGSGVMPPSIRSPLLSDFQAIDNTILGTSGNWSSIFRPISKGGPLEANAKITASAPSFGGAFLPNLPANVWTSGGLKVTASDLTAGVYIENLTGFAESIQLIDNGTYKITALPDFTSPSIPFVPALVMDVFLVPALTSPGVYDGFVDAGGFTFAETGGFFYTTIYRPSLFDSGDAHYFAYNLPFLDAWTGFYYWLLYLKSKAVSKAGLLTGDPGGDFWSVVSIASLGTVPPFTLPPTIPPTNPPNGSTLPRYDGNLTPGNIPYSGGQTVYSSFAFSGALIAVVQKGSQKYYFWTP